MGLTHAAYFLPWASRLPHRHTRALRPCRIAGLRHPAQERRPRRGLTQPYALLGWPSASRPELRYRARYFGPDGKRKGKAFPDGQKRLAEQWLSKVTADVACGDYIDPAASRTPFQTFVEGARESERGPEHPGVDAVSAQAACSPAHMQEFVSQLEASGMSGAYARVIFSNVRVDDGYLCRNPCHSRTVTLPGMWTRRVVPWQPDRVFARRGAMVERFGPWRKWAPDAACARARSSDCPWPS